MGELAENPCFTPQRWIVQDPKHGMPRCLLCDKLATVAHLATEGHTDKASWYKQTSAIAPQDPHVQHYNRYFEEQKAKFRQVANDRAGNPVPPPPPPPQEALPVRTLPEQSARQPNSEPRILISLPKSLAIRLRDFLNAALNEQQANPP